MSEIGKIVNKRIGDLEVVCRELTVGRLRALLAAQPEMDVVRDLLFEDVRLGDLPVLTNLTIDQIEDLPPSALRLVVAGCREANPDFFAMLARLKQPQPAGNS